MEAHLLYEEWKDKFKARSRHGGPKIEKYLDWFSDPTTCWSKESLTRDQFENLMMWSANEYPASGLWDGQDVTRLLGLMARKAVDQGDYFTRSPENYKHGWQQEYYQVILRDNHYLDVDGPNPILIRQLKDNKDYNLFNIVPYYVHDGFGRCIAYMSLILEGKIEFPIDGFRVYVVKRCTIN